MNWYEKIHALFLVPGCIWHLLKVKRRLQTNPDARIVVKSNSRRHKSQALKVVVKSYFWSCRLIPNCRCLQRSIALFEKLSAMGYAVKHKYGVLKSNPKDTLSAHAWVEIDGKALNETKNLNQFIELTNTNDPN
jgi:hypothetical protein